MKNGTKKIALFVPSLAGGGAEKMMIHLAEYFTKIDLNIDFIVAEKRYTYNPPRNVNVIYFNSKKLKYSLFPLIKYLKKEKPDILLSTLAHSNIIAVLAKLLSFSKAKIIIRVANTLSISLKKESRIKRTILKSLMIIFYRLANEIVTNSKGSADDLAKNIKISRNKIKVIYNPTITSKTLGKAKKEADHPWLKNKELPVIMGMGRLTKQKDFPTLIKAFNIFRQKQKARLIILGEGEERENLEKLIKELDLEKDISMPGFVENPYAYLAQADIFVLSSLYEGLPNVLIEALACGAQIISTDCPSGPEEILKNGKYGKLVPAGNKEKMAEAIEYIFKNPLSREILKKRGRQFSVENSAKQYLKVMN